MIGQIYKIHSDFYYVNTENGIIECKLREVLKKAKAEVLVGDFVDIENFSADTSLNFICSVVNRKNALLRPKVANITRCIIVTALKNPDINFEQLDRFIALSELNGMEPVLCFNKSDLDIDGTFGDYVRKIYSPLGYKMFFISALSQKGTKEFFEILKDNVSLFYGMSGVGKSSIVKLLSDSKNLKIKKVSQKTGKGTHTTRHCEIYSVGENVSVVDTPGFSNIKFDFLMPKEIEKLFREFNKEKEVCRFKDCLHINEIGCKILENPEFFSVSRYESYKKFVEEAKIYKEKIKNSGNKTESAVKYNRGKNITKISENKRQLSRKVQKQSISEEYND